jgi:methyl-accepting chemotaxis protein
MIFEIRKAVSCESEKLPGDPMQKILSRLSLTTKLASIVIAINLVGLSVFALRTWNDQTTKAISQASEAWKNNTEQFASVAAGGVKWGKADAVQDAYKLYRADPSLELLQFAATNISNEAVDLWQRDGETGLPAKDALLTALKGHKAETTIDLSNAASGYVTVIAPLPKTKSGAELGFVTTNWSTSRIYTEALQNALSTLAFQGIFVIVTVAALLFALRNMVARPLNILGERINALQQGDLESPVAYLEKTDQIGLLARALDHFRKEAIAKVEQAENSRLQQVAIDAERSRNAQAASETAETQFKIMSRLASALEELASGNFAAKLEELGPDFQKVYNDFNKMVNSVSKTLEEIAEAATQVELGSANLAGSSDELAKRTEQQAASLEQTAAALDEITTTVRVSSQKASDAGTQVTEAKTSAHSSATIVKEAIGAMDRIQDSSAKIGQIIGVIDEIAFQTNLLALNAGVEAARAGDAGKGFAVVAQEVRELAQRSANAAKEIKSLISNSNHEVESGVDLVNKTGDSLLKIEDQINGISETIQSIVQSYREQSSGLLEINSAINHMDQATQQNAAMVEETNAACQELLSQSTVLKESVGRFQLQSTVRNARSDSYAAYQPGQRAAG